MNKMEILKNAFEQIGFKTKVEPYYEDYVLYIEGTHDGDGYKYHFTFNQNFEPTLFDWDTQDNILLNDYYKKIEESVDNEE